MLRSRSNRQQRPSESTDEQQGRSDKNNGYNYGGYPSSSSGTSGASPMIGIASGADDDYSYGGQPKKGAGGGGRSRFGFGSNKKSPSSGGGGGGSFSNRNNNVWDKKSVGSTIKSPKNNSGTGSAGFILFAVAFILLVVTGGATFHYRKMVGRMEHELMVLKRRGKTNRFHRDHREELDEEEEEEVKEIEDAPTQDENNDNSQAEEELLDLRDKKEKMEDKEASYEHRFEVMEDEHSSLQTQMDLLQHEEHGELFMLEEEVFKLRAELVAQGQRGKEYKEQFIATHKSGASGIVPGGPGHALVQKKEIEKMETIDDYEDYVQRREDALWDKIDLLVEKMGLESRREATEWFGPGPHMVELEIEYPQYVEDKSPIEWPIVRGVLTIEMAPLPLMAVSVNLFLQQVHHKLWVGCSFVINAMHILQAGPHRYATGGKYDANQPDLVARFQKARLDKMPFQEYHEEFPHDKYTLGFAGRPGGPDFYINKINNSANHGPGGQSHHDLHEEADPCFAKLVGGMGILDDLNKIPVDHDKGALLMHPVVIVDSRVVASREATEQPQKIDGSNNNNNNAAQMPVNGPSQGI